MAYERFQAPVELLTLTNPDKVKAFSNAAKKHYSPGLRYHNWDHALVVMRGVEIIAKKLETKGVHVALGALTVAAAWHDAGYSETRPEYKTKEAYSAHLLDEFLKEKPVSAFEHQLMRNAILATWHGHKDLRTPHELILHRADIANIGGPTAAFLDNTVNVWLEGNKTTKTPLPWLEYVRNTGNFMGTVVREHDTESTRHYIALDDTTVDANVIPFRQAATANWEALKNIKNAPRAA